MRIDIDKDLLGASRKVSMAECNLRHVEPRPTTKMQSAFCCVKFAPRGNRSGLPANYGSFLGSMSIDFQVNNTGIFRRIEGCSTRPSDRPVLAPFPITEPAA